MWSASQMLQWRWAPLPAWLANGLGASDATRPCWPATARTVWRYVIWLSAARERRRVADRQLLLAPAELGMRQLDGQALVGQGRDDVLDDRLGRLHPDRAEAQAPVDGHVAAVGPHREVELVLERGVERQVHVLGPGDHPLEERPRVERPRRVVELDHVHDHLGAARGIRQEDEGLRIGNEPDLADGAVGRVRGEEVEARERLHPLDEADPALHPPRELPDVGALAADDAAVVAVEEADQLNARGPWPGRRSRPVSSACLDRVGGTGTDRRTRARGLRSGGQDRVAWRYGAGTFSGTTSAPSVNLPSLTAIIVTPFWGTWMSGPNVTSR